MYGIGGEVMPPMLRVCTRTWMRDSHDLFDYETQQQVTSRQFATSSTLKLLRSDANISAVDCANGSEMTLDREHDHLLTIISKRAGQYILTPAEKIMGSRLYPQKLWIIVRALPGRRYALQENDIIKLGRFRLKVKKLVPKIHPSTSADESVVSSPNDSALVKLYDGAMPEITTPKEELMTMQCRICLSEGGSLDDKLICVCECKGSIKYVHVECLQKWINSRWNIREDEPLPSMVFIREVACELCKARFPSCIRQNGETIQIMRFPKMALPFIVLENVTPHAVKGVHLLSLSDMKDLKLGRGHESDVRIPDVSISRYHATIRYEGDQFYLEDHDSKFGTLVAMRRPKLIGAADNVAVQVGRSVVELSLDHNLPFVPGCIDIPPVPGSFSFCGGPEASQPTPSPCEERSQRDQVTERGNFQNQYVDAQGYVDGVTHVRDMNGETNQSILQGGSPNDHYNHLNAFQEPAETYLQMLLQNQLRNHILNQLRCVSREAPANRIFQPLEALQHPQNHQGQFSRYGQFRLFSQGGRVNAPCGAFADVGDSTAVPYYALPDSAFTTDFTDVIQPQGAENGEMTTDAAGIGVDDPQEIPSPTPMAELPTLAQLENNARGSFMTQFQRQLLPFSSGTDQEDAGLSPHILRNKRDNSDNNPRRDALDGYHQLG